MDYIFDIDGTLANCEHRMHYIKHKPKNYKAFYATGHLDSPMHPMCQLARTIDATEHSHIIFCTGRPEEMRAATTAWLLEHALVRSGPISLYMRADNDYRQDTVVKDELYDRILADGFQPQLVFDDRPRVCDMWKSRGLLVARIGDREDF